MGKSKNDADSESAVSLMIDESIRQMNTLEGRIKTAGEDYFQLKKNCESSVVEWRWATADMSSLKLHNNLRGRGPRGRWVKKQPKNSMDRFAHGFNAADRVVVVRKGIMLADDVHHQIFITYGDDYVESVEFDSMFPNPHVVNDRDRLVRVARQSIVDNIPVDCTWYAAHQRGYETYDYEAGRLISMDSTWTNQPHKAEHVLSAKYKASYDDDGSLALLTIDYRPVGHHKGGLFTCYKKK